MLALTASDFPALELVLPVVLVAIVLVAGILFARSGPELRRLGSGPWALDRDSDHERAGTGAEAAEEVRQMVEASDYRARMRGEDGIDVEVEIARLSGTTEDSAWAVEIRQVVIANNERRERRGEPPLNVEAEVARRLAEWT